MPLDDNVTETFESFPHNIIFILAGNVNILIAFYSSAE